MPKKKRQPKKSDLTQFIIEKSIPHKEEEHSALKVVYFPSCINQTMGLSKEAPVKHALVPRRYGTDVLRTDMGIEGYARHCRP